MADLHLLYIVRKHVFERMKSYYSPSDKSFELYGYMLNNTELEKICHLINYYKNVIMLPGEEEFDVEVVERKKDNDDTYLMLKKLLREQFISRFTTCQILWWDNIQDDTYCMCRVTGPVSVMKEVFDKPHGITPSVVQVFRGHEKQLFRFGTHILDQIDTLRTTIKLCQDVEANNCVEFMALDHHAVKQIFHLNLDITTCNGIKQNTDFLFDQDNINFYNFSINKMIYEWNYLKEQLLLIKTEFFDYMRSQKIKKSNVSDVIHRWIRFHFVKIIYPNAPANQPILCDINGPDYSRIILALSNLHNGNNIIHEPLQYLGKFCPEECTLAKGLRAKIGCAVTGVHVSVTAKRLRSHGAWALKMWDEGRWPDDIPNVYQILMALMFAYRIVVYSFYRATIITPGHIAMVKMYTFGFWMYFGDFTKRNFGLGNTAFNGVYVSDTVLSHVPFLYLLKSKGMAPIQTIEESQEAQLQYSQQEKQRIRNNNNFEIVERNLKAKEFHNTGGWNRSHNLRHRPQEPQAQQPMILISGCFFHIENHLQPSTTIFTKKKKQTASELIRSNSIKFGLRQLLMFFMRKDMLPHAYLSKTSGFLVINQPFHIIDKDTHRHINPKYQFPSINMESKHIEEIKEQNNDEFNLTNKNCLLLCVCNKCTYEKMGIFSMQSMRVADAINDYFGKSNFNINVRSQVRSGKVGNVIPFRVVGVIYKYIVRKSLKQFDDILHRENALKSIINEYVSISLLCVYLYAVYCKPSNPSLHVHNIE